MYCPYCKTPIPEDSVFCTECGKPVEQAEQSYEEEQTAQQLTEQFVDQETDWTFDQQVESDEEIPPIQPTKSFDALGDDSPGDEAQDLQKTAEEQALDHLFGDSVAEDDNVDEDENENIDRADLTQQIMSVDAQVGASEEDDASQLLISADLKKRKSNKKASKKKASKEQDSSPNLTRQMSPAEVEEQHPHQSDGEDATEQAKISTGVAGNPRQVQQQSADEENRNAEQIITLDNTSDRHVVAIITIVIIAIFAVIALTFALVYFDPFDLSNTQENPADQTEDIAAPDEEDPEFTDNNDSNNEIDDDDIYAINNI